MKTKNETITLIGALQTGWDNHRTTNPTETARKFLGQVGAATHRLNSLLYRIWPLGDKYDQDIYLNNAREGTRIAAHIVDYVSEGCQPAHTPDILRVLAYGIDNLVAENEGIDETNRNAAHDIRGAMLALAESIENQAAQPAATTMQRPDYLVKKCAEGYLAERLNDDAPEAPVAEAQRASKGDLVGPYPNTSDLGVNLAVPCFLRRERDGLAKLARNHEHARDLVHEIIHGC